MIKESDFFSSKNIIQNLSNTELEQTSDYLEPLKAMARTTYNSIYVINYLSKGFDYVSENPLFLCGHTPEEVKEMGYSFYFKYVVKSDIELLVKINNIGFDFYDNIPVEDRKNHTISYDFHIKNQESRIILINQKLTPLFLTKNGKIWKALCVISLSSERNSGNVKIYKKGDSKVFRYNMSDNYWKSSEELKLTKREKEIIALSSRGFTINDIADEIFVSPNTVKFHRRKLFDKLEVLNISEAISCAIYNNLL